MNSPETRNVLGFGEQSWEIEAVCARILSDPAIRTVALTGAGRSFCAGGDIKSMVDQSKDSSLQPIDDRYYYKEGIHRIPRALYELEVPVIAAVNGAAIEAGLDLACMYDIRIASLRKARRLREILSNSGLFRGTEGHFFSSESWAYPRLQT